jgi:hypothetical protein
LVTHDPLKQADVVSQVETVWYCLVTVMGCTVVLVAPGQGSMVVKGSAMATPANRAVAAALVLEKRMLNERNE